MLVAYPASEIRDAALTAALAAPAFAAVALDAVLRRRRRGPRAATETRDREARHDEPPWTAAQPSTARRGPAVESRGT